MNMAVRRPVSSGCSRCFRLGVQSGLHQRGHGEGTPAASQRRYSHPDVRTPAHDPVRLQPQPGQSGPLQQQQVQLLDVWNYEISYPESIKALVQLHSHCVYS